METPQIWAAEPDIDGLRLANSLIKDEPERALAQLQDLEHRGSVMSLVYMGYMFENGFGVTADLATAERYYRRAFQAGSTDGLFSLGAIFWRSRDYAQAERMFRLGAERRDPRSLYWLACLYLNNSADSDRHKKAANLLEEAYGKGHIQSGRKLGRLWMSGRFGLRRAISGFWLIIWAAVIGAKIAVLNPSDERVKDLPL